MTDLSGAIVLFLKHHPGTNTEEFRAQVGSEGVRDAVRLILDETRSVHVEWERKTLSDIGEEVRDVMRQRHPDLSDAALHKLGSYYTYLVR